MISLHRENGINLMQLNPILVKNIQEIYGERGETWLNQLPAQMEKICKKWHLEFLHALPQLTYHFVSLVRTESGATAVLKMAVDSSLIQHEQAWLKCFTAGVPKIYWYDNENSAFLLEHLVPGHSLKNVFQQGDDDTATRTIARLILTLQAHQEVKQDFKPITQHIPTLLKLKNHVDDKLLSKAIGLFAELTSDPHNAILHGDLHHDNILASHHEWKAIDPHGYIGDPAFEVGAMMVNPYDCLPDKKFIGNMINKRLKILIEELPFDCKRIQAWAFCRTVLSAAWTFEDHAKIDTEELEIARLIDAIKV